MACTSLLKDCLTFIYTVTDFQHYVVISNGGLQIFKIIYFLCIIIYPYCNLDCMLFPYTLFSRD
jgi:hypothetical protein